MFYFRYFFKMNVKKKKRIKDVVYIVNEFRYKYLVGMYEVLNVWNIEVL